VIKHTMTALSAAQLLVAGSVLAADAADPTTTATGIPAGLT
jgi:hypothetical protein